MSKQSLILFLALTLFMQNAFSAFSCESLFAIKPVPKSQVSVELEQRIRQFAQQELSEMSAEDIFTLREEARKQEQAIMRIETRNATYKKMNGSERNRLAIEEDHRIRKIKNELKRGSVDQAVEALKTDFINFEINFIYLTTLKTEIDYLKKNDPDKQELIANKMKEVIEAEKFLGRNYYRYAAIREMLDELVNSKIANQTQYAREALRKFQDIAKIQSTKQILNYRKIKMSEVEDYIEYSTVSRKSLEQKVALSEFWTMVKMLTLSGPLVNFVKAIIYKFPQKMKLFGLAEVSPRTVMSDMIGLGYNQHLRDVYIEKIEAVLELNGQPEEQVKLLKSLNATSEKKDELLVLFARVPENEKVWLEIKEQAKKMTSENAFAENFLKRLQSAETKAISDGEFPLYYAEAGATVFGKIAAGGIVGYYALSTYLSQNPDQVNSATSLVKSCLHALGH